LIIDREFSVVIIIDIVSHHTFVERLSLTMRQS